jgi:hypothetical protein
MPDASKFNIDAEYPDRPTLAKLWGCSSHTIFRYEKQPNGLPNLWLAGRKRYPWKEACEWLEARVKRPNPVRAA